MAREGILLISFSLRTNRKYRTQFSTIESKEEKNSQEAMRNKFKMSW
jgi:hypothetical protein